MPLADVLSALREIILDAPQLPQEFAARDELFKSRFPRLSAEEREDLAKIEPDKFGIYTNTIFSGESSVLAQHFRITFALLGDRLNKASAQKLDEYALTREIHRLAPWKSNTTLALGECLLRALQQNVFDFKKLAPEAEDLARLELLSLKIRRAADEERFKGSILSVSDLCELSVGELLECRVIVPIHAERVEFSWDVVNCRTSYYTNDETLNPEIKAGKFVAIGSRNAEGNVRWLNVSHPADVMFAAVRSRKMLKVEEAAGEFLDAGEEFASEQEALNAFMEQFLPLVEIGALRAAR